MPSLCGPAPFPPWDANRAPRGQVGFWGTRVAPHGVQTQLQQSCPASWQGPQSIIPGSPQPLCPYNCSLGTSPVGPPAPVAPTVRINRELPSHPPCPPTALQPQEQQELSSRTPFCPALWLPALDFASGS